MAIGVVRIGELRPYVIVWLGGSALADVLITLAMVTIVSNMTYVYYTSASDLAFLFTSCSERVQNQLSHRPTPWLANLSS